VRWHDFTSLRLQFGSNRDDFAPSNWCRPPIEHQQANVTSIVTSIHGTNDAKSIGSAQSSGCFRMINSAALHLASLADVGTTVSHALELAAKRKIVPTSPAENIDAPKSVEKRDRVLSEGEVKSFWLATSSLPLPYDAFHRALLLTAQRREEVAGMRWPEVDVEKGTWLIPKERTKNGKEHLVHLSPQVLAALPVRGDSAFVFASAKGHTSISGYSKAKGRLDQAMNPAKPWRVHDLRRTAASGMASLGFQPHIIERVLNHVSGAQGGLVGVYQRYEYIEDRKRALCAWGNHVEALVSDKPVADNIVPLRA
jgi:integrase